VLYRFKFYLTYLLTYLLCCEQIACKLYRVHVKRTINFDNPTFSTDKDASNGAQRVPLAQTTDPEQGNVYESVA